MTDHEHPPRPDAGVAGEPADHHSPSTADVSVVVDMKPAWWGYAMYAAGAASRAITQLHPATRAVHDTTIDECTATIQKLATAEVTTSDETWPALELTGTDIRVIYEGLIEILFTKRDTAAGGEWNWDQIDLPREWTWVETTLRALRPAQDSLTPGSPRETPTDQ